MRKKPKIISSFLILIMVSSCFFSTTAVFGAETDSSSPEVFSSTETQSSSEETTDATEASSTATATSYKITTSVNSTKYGSITAGANVTEGNSFMITATPKSGYYLSDLQVDGKTVGAMYTYTFKDVNAPHSVKAVFSKVIKVMLDAGHSGKYNQSPVFKSYYESIMNWDLHNYLKDELLKYNGFQVGVTRTNQAVGMEPYYRGSASAGYNLFLAIHSNACGSSSVDYPLIITQKGNTKHDLAKGLGKTIETTMGTKQSYQTWQKLNSDGKTEYYGMLRGSKAVGTFGLILEHSFHTNLAATKWLYDQNKLKKLAKAEAATIAKYYGLKLQKSKPIVSTNQKVKVLVKDLNMRESYSDSSKIMGQATKDKIYQLKAITSNGEWGQLKTNGYWIYLKKGYTKLIPLPKTVASKEKVKVLVKDLNMRQSYSTGSKIMGTATKGKVYQLKAKTRDGNWGQIKSNGYWIYLKNGYTKKV